MTLPKGIRRHGAGWQTYVRINKKLRTQSWPMATKSEVMTDWIVTQRKLYADLDPTGFAADIDAFCNRKAAVVTIAQMRQHLTYVAECLGRDRSRHSITPADLDVVFSGLLKKRAIATVGKYRSSVRSFFNVMDPDRINPVLKAKIPARPPATPKGRDMATIRAILGHLATTRGLGKLRAAVMAHTGLPPKLLGQVMPGDLLPTPAAPIAVRVSPRRKGAGVSACVLPLTDEGIAAFQAFHAANAYGKFTTWGINDQIKRAAAKVGIDPKSITLYHLRHSFLTFVYVETKDIETVARFAMHAEGSPLTIQYAKAAANAVDVAAVAALNASMRRIAAPPPVPPPAAVAAPGASIAAPAMPEAAAPVASFLAPLAPAAVAGATPGAASALSEAPSGTAASTQVASESCQHLQAA